MLPAPETLTRVLETTATGPVTALHEDPDGALWVALGDRVLLHRPEADTRELLDLSERHPRALPIRELAPSRRGVLLAVADGLLELDREGRVRRLGQVLERPARCILARRDGSLLLGTQSGVLVLNDGVWQPIPGLPTAPVSDLVEDADGGVWIASPGAGLWLWREGELWRFRRESHLRGLHDDVVAAAARLPPGRALDRQRDARRRPHRPPRHGLRLAGRCGIVGPGPDGGQREGDRRGCARRPVDRLRRRRAQALRSRRGNRRGPRRTAQAGARPRRGAAAKGQRAPARWRRPPLDRHARGAAAARARRVGSRDCRNRARRPIRARCCSPPTAACGSASARAGCGATLRDGRVRPVGFAGAKPPLRRQPMVLALFEDRDRSLWVGTAAGLARLAPDGEAAVFVTLEVDGREANPGEALVRDFLLDREERLWLATHGGLLRVERRDPQRAPGQAPSRRPRERMAIPPSTPCSRRGTARCGSPATPGFGASIPRPDRGGTSTGGTASRRSSSTAAPRSGCATAGWCSAASAARSSNARGAPREVGKPPIRISAVELVEEAGRRLRLEPAPAHLELRSGHSVIGFHFGAVDPAALAAYRFAWRLAGLESAWTPAGAARSATFSHLPPGRYRFELIAESDEFGESKTSVALTVHPPVVGELDRDQRLRRRRAGAARLPVRGPASAAPGAGGPRARAGRARAEAAPRAVGLGRRVLGLGHRRVAASTGSAPTCCSASASPSR
ncbi:MAG: triple tyrosine motif-containing protein [Xanthomonadales bacterium]|nr:triple tyrosine motif-containing protein [Xanthomonadales bacterium]